MRVKTLVEVGTIEVEADVHIEDVLAAMTDRSDGVLNLLNSIAMGLKAVTTEDIEKLRPQQRALMVQFLEEAVERFRITEDSVS